MQRDGGRCKPFGGEKQAAPAAGCFIGGAFSAWLL